MDKDVELTSFLLRHLRDNGYFKSKQAMATEFEMSKRILQRLMNTPEQLKGGSLALGKVLHYFGEHAIPLDDILTKYFASSTQSPDLSHSKTTNVPAYMNHTAKRITETILTKDVIPNAPHRSI